MPCHTMKISGGGYAIVCTRGRKAKPCAFCGKPSDKLCDWPVGNGKTCDKPCCVKCSRHVGPDQDFCKDHEGQKLAL